MKRLCQVIDIARSSYYAWINAADTRAARATADVELADKIRAIHADDNTYGRPRITAEINHGQPAGQRINHKRIARIMRANNIEGVRLRSWATTDCVSTCRSGSPGAFGVPTARSSPGLRRQCGRG